MYKLYIIMRSDLESLSPGKLGAQAAHAAGQLAHQVRFSQSPLLQEVYDVWERSPANEAGDDDPNLFGFGTTIVLNGGDLNYTVPNAMLSGCVRDPSYPVRDGSFTHLIDIKTCYWVFDDLDANESLGRFISSFRLY